MTKKLTFLDTPQWNDIVQNIKGIYTSDGTMATLIDFERVLDEADIYAFKNWKFGELVDGPVIKRYEVACTFMWPMTLMPDPRGAKRLLPLGCRIAFRKTTIKVPIEIESSDDFKSGTHYPKMINRKVWLINIVIPKQLMSDIREGSVDIADQSIDLQDLDDAYAKDYDTESMKENDNEQATAGGFGGSMLGSLSSSDLGGPSIGGGL